MKKRVFLSLAVCAVAVAGLMSGCATQQGKTIDKTIALQLYTVRDGMRDDAAGTLQKVADMGFKELELAGYADGQFYNMEPADFRKLCNDLGMKVIASHVGARLSRDTYEESMRWWMSVIDAHNKLGAAYLVMPTPPIDYETATKEDLDLVCKYLNDIGVNCNSSAIRFGYHNHAWEFNTVIDIDGTPTTVFDYLVTHTDPTRVSFQLDVYWCQEGGFNPVEIINKYPDRIQLLHIKDVREIGASGQMDFKSIFEAAYATGRVKAYIVEQEDYSGEVFQSVQQSFDFLYNSDFVKKDIQ